MQFELKRLPYNCSKNEIKAEISRVAFLSGSKILTRKAFDELAKITSGRIMKKFGLTWQEILQQNGLGERYSGQTVSDKMKDQLAKEYSDDEMIEEIRRIAKSLGQSSLSQKEFGQNSAIGATVACRRFGTWKNALDKAGLIPKWQSIPEIEYFENLLTVWTFYGRQPSYGEMDLAPSRIKARSYEGKFKKWRSALEAFVTYANSDFKIVNSDTDSQPALPPKSEVMTKSEKPADRRTISLGLRYAILSRDKFRCVKCGKSPATHAACTLHVDHILPWSKGGRTVIDNLQTACSDCNLGKGNRYDV